MPLPLTSQLGSDSDLRRWFAARFSDLDAVTRDVPKAIRCLVPRRLPDVIPPWLLGMAFDWRLRLGLEVPADPRSTTAFAGWIRAFGNAPVEGPQPHFFHDPVTVLLGHARGHGAGAGGPPSDRDELELARISVVLALYESWYRGGVRPDAPLHRLGPVPDAAALRALCPPAAARELARLVAVARCALAPLFPASSIETNPVFDAHGIPADGDLIVDGMLLDLKTVTRPHVQLRWLWQMVGYVLLDGGRRRLDSVGLYLSRHGWLHRWSVAELLSCLAGEAVTVDRVRQEFLAVAGGNNHPTSRPAERASSLRGGVFNGAGDEQQPSGHNKPHSPASLLRRGRNENAAEAAGGTGAGVQ